MTSCEPDARAPSTLVLALASGDLADAPVPALLPIGGCRLIEHLLGTLEEVGARAPLILTPHDAAPELERAVGTRGRVIALRAPGRASALREALAHLPGDDPVLIHEAERALTPAATVREVLTCADLLTEHPDAERADAVVPAIPVTDSVKSSGPHGLRNVDRGGLVSLQAPRLLRRGLLEEVLAAPASETRRDATSPRLPTGGTGGDDPLFDEITAAIALGAAVRRVPGSHRGAAVRDRLSLWEAQIALGLARDTGARRR